MIQGGKGKGGRGGGAQELKGGKDGPRKQEKGIWTDRNSAEAQLKENEDRGRGLGCSEEVIMG